MSRGTLLLGAALIAIIVVLTTWPVVFDPQLEPDDFRYLANLESLDAGTGTLREALSVENRWDHLWFVASNDVVRFFRPTVVASMWLDRLVWGFAPELTPHARYLGLFVTNIMLHVACCLAVLIVLWRYAAGWPAVLAGGLFAGFACHAELLWYVSGRTSALAAIGFLGGLACHVWAEEPRRWLRWIALPAFAFAFASKELTACLPVVCVLHDRYVAHRAPSVAAVLRRDALLWCGYAAIGVGYWVLRSQMIEDATGTRLFYPYFVSPVSSRFPTHVWTELRTYADNLFAAGITRPFMRADQLAETSSWAGFGLAIGFAGLCVRQLRRDKAALVLAAAGVGAWLPTSFVYVSERYLYIPSFAVAGLAALLIARSWPRPGRRQIAILLAVVWTAHQSTSLFRKNAYLTRLPRPGFAVSKILRDVAPRLPRGKPILVLNWPSDVVHAQFLEDQLRVELDAPRAVVRVLTLMPSGQRPDAPFSVVRTSDRTLEVRGADLMARPRIFPLVEFERGKSWAGDRLGFKATVLDASRNAVRRVRFDFARPLEEQVVLRFRPPPFEGPLGLRIAEGRFEILRP